MSLRAKWTLTLLLAAALPLFVLALAMVRIQRDGLSVAEKSTQLAVIDQVSDAVDRTLDEAAEATHRVGRLLGESSITDDEARLALASEVMARAPVLAQVAIYDRGGALIDAINQADAPAPRPPATLPASPDEPTGRWLPPRFEGTTLLLRRVEGMSSSGPPRGFVLGTLAPGALSRRLRDISQSRFGREDRVTLLTDELQLLAGVAPVAPGGSLRDKDIFTAIALRPGALATAFGVSTEFRSADGEEMVGTVRLLANRLMVAVRRPQSEVFEALARARRALFAVGLGVAVLVLLLGSWLAARTSRPVGHLAALAAAYGRREFATRSPIRSGDELQQLGGAMEQMADELLRSEVELARRQVVEANLSRYLPAEVARAVAAGRQSLGLGGERRQITVLLADVVAFTPFAESAPPERVVAFLNELFTVLTEVIFRHGGMVDKFMGDSVMALFGAPEPQEDHAVRALAAAEDIHRFVESTNPAWHDAYGLTIQLGVGVSSGEALVGNLGSETRMEYTAIGDMVNVAARLEAMARPGQTLVTAQVVAQAGAGFTFRSLGTHPLRGKRNEVEILEVR